MAKEKQKNGKLKKKYHDLPRFPVVYKYEADFKEGFKGMSDLLVKDIGKTLKKAVNGRGK
jgi:hypothetical protein